MGGDLAFELLCPATFVAWSARQQHGHVRCAHPTGRPVLVNRRGELHVAHFVQRTFEHPLEIGIRVEVGDHPRLQLDAELGCDSEGLPPAPDVVLHVADDSRDGFRDLFIGRQFAESRVRKLSDDIGNAIGTDGGQRVAQMCERGAVLRKQRRTRNDEDDESRSNHGSIQ